MVKEICREELKDVIKYDDIFEWRGSWWFVSFHVPAEHSPWVEEISTEGDIFNLTCSPCCRKKTLFIQDVVEETLIPISEKHREKLERMVARMRLINPNTPFRVK